MNKTEGILVAGRNGLLGSALVRRLRSDGLCNLLLVGHANPAQTGAGATARFFDEHSPENVLLGVGKIASVTGCTGIIEWNTGKPDGAPRKLFVGRPLCPFDRLPVEGLRCTFRRRLGNATHAEACS